MKYVKKGQTSKCFTRISTNSAHPNVVTVQKNLLRGPRNSHHLKKTTCQHLDPYKKDIKTVTYPNIILHNPQPPNKNWPTILQHQSLKTHKKTTIKTWQQRQPADSFRDLVIPRVGGHFIGDFGYLTIPKRSQRIASSSCCHWLVSFHRQKKS